MIPKARPSETGAMAAAARSGEMNPTGFATDAKFSRGPLRKAATMANTAPNAAAGTGASRQRPARSLPSGKIDSSSGPARKTKGSQAQATSQAAISPNGSDPGDVTLATIAYSVYSVWNAAPRPAASRTRPTRLSGRLERTTAPTVE